MRIRVALRTEVHPSVVSGGWEYGERLKGRNNSSHYSFIEKNYLFLFLSLSTHSSHKAHPVGACPSMPPLMSLVLLRRPLKRGRDTKKVPPCRKPKVFYRTLPLSLRLKPLVLPLKTHMTARFE